VEDYLTWELWIKTLWRLHAYTEDKKVRHASSEFDGYALRWWDSILKQRRAAHELPVLQWRERKEIMQARFVPTNYLRSVFDILTQLKQGVLTVDAYYKEMELLTQRSSSWVYSDDYASVFARTQTSYQEHHPTSCLQ
jgi:hypothetical protein